jgi:hypothetical protein
MPAVLPPADFVSARLRVHKVGPYQTFGRIYMAGFPDPLGYGKSNSRFSDPRRRKAANRFGVLYLGETLAVCFLEAVLRDRKDGVAGELELEERELDDRRYVTVETSSSLRLVDLRENNAIAMGVPSEVMRGVRQHIGRVWSVAFHDHPDGVDGIIYPSRLNGHVNLAIYGRSVGKLQPTRLRRLVDVAELAPILDDLEVAFAPPSASHPGVGLLP